MKNTIYSLLALAALTLASCEDFTDVQPKGKNLLATTDQLEMLLNNKFDGSNTDMRVIAGDMIYAYSNLATTLSQPVKTRNVIMWTYDEASMDRMAELTASDSDYADYYGIIGKISNPILQQIDAASGTESAKRQIKCEALALRAWSYYMLVNKFSKAYNPATAETDPGIIIMTEDIDITDPQPKSTVKQVYDRILADINEAIDLGGLPDAAVNKMRMCKPAAYAIKAQALMSMQDWDGAEEAAKQAIAINGIITDYNSECLGTTQGYIIGGTYTVIDRGKTGTGEDYFFNYSYELFNAYTADAWANFETGHAYKDKMTTDWTLYDNMMGMSESYLGESGWTFSYDLNSYWNDGGLRSPHMYLIIAECELHKGNIDTAMEYLDMLRVCRIDPAVYQPLLGNVTTEADAMAHVKQVTMNENIYSVNIFIDKKRWNQISGWEATYSRTIAGQTYSIAPDSKMWIFPFPMDAMNNNPNLTQNYKE